MTNVVQMPPRTERRQRQEMGFFVRVGHNDHREMLNLLASGESGIFGLVISAQHAGRHAELIADARDRGFDVILDPKTQEMATPGAYSNSLAGLPWGGEDFHRVPDFQGAPGRALVERIVEFAIERQFTQLIGPTHLIANPNDLWLRTDVAAMGLARDAIASARVQMPLIYSLAVPISVLRNRTLRQALLPAVADVPCDAIWLKVENFGDDASGDKTVAYMEACRDFHAAGIPVVADHVGGLPGLAALAFGAVGGIAHGIAVHQSFQASGWRRPPKEDAGSFAPPAKRVYIRQLDTFLKPDVARQLLQSSPRARGHFACNDQHCCPRGMHDMLANPGRHALYQRAREIEQIAAMPQSVRVQGYLDGMVRTVSDDVARAAGFASLPDDLRQKLGKKQTQVSSFRSAVTHVSEAPLPSIAVVPIRRSAR